jgi:hypothetical protein
VLLDDEPLLAVITLDDVRRAIAKLRVYVVGCEELSRGGF